MSINIRHINNYNLFFIINQMRLDYEEMYGNPEPEKKVLA